MAIVDLIMPKMGESIMEATILRWHKKVGEPIKQDETVLDIATDKVDSEVPSTVSGIISELLFNVNDVVPIGSVIAKIETNTTASTPNNNPTPENSFNSSVNEEKPAIIEVPTITPTTILQIEPEIVAVAADIPFTPTTTTVSTKSMNNRFFSPLVLNIANSEGLSLSELELITGTGAEGRVSKKDILQYIADKKAGKLPAFVPQPVYQQPVYSVPAEPLVQQQPIATPQVEPTFVAPTQPVYKQPVSTAPVAPPAPQQPITPPQVEPTFVAPETAQPIQQQSVYIPPAPIVDEEKTTVQEQAIAAKTAPIEMVKIEEKAKVEEPNILTAITEAQPIIQQPVYIPPAPIVTVAEQPIATTPIVEKINIVETVNKITEAAVLPVKTAALPNLVASQQVVMPVQQPDSSNAIPLVTLAEGDKGKFVQPNAAVPTGNVEIIEMDRMRKLIAKHMVDSKHISPHVTSFVEADVTNMVLWRERVKTDFERREGTKLTFTPMFIDCLVKVMQHYPMVNASVDGDKIIIKKDFNIGMATALPNGNLIVPVIKAANKLNIVGLSNAVNTMANNARNGQLKPDETSGGTFTLTNVGTFGSLMGTPIINQPQVAILAVGAIKKRPVVIESPEGDTIGIRHMMYLSLSYDHRIVDGSIGASFLTAVAKEFEAWDINRTWYQYM